MDEYIKRKAVLKIIDDNCPHDKGGFNTEEEMGAGAACYYIRKAVNDIPTVDVAPRAEIAMEIFAEIEEIFEKFKMRQCSNSVCAWCVHATDYGRRNEECDQPYVDKNGKEQKACYVYAKFESLIDKELAELKKEYTEAEPPKGE